LITWSPKKTLGTSGAAKTIVPAKPTPVRIDMGIEKLKKWAWGGYC